MRFLTLHGHFYQPPRENPWLEAVEAEPGAAPYHDWNERVTAECYAANTAARRVDGDNRIIDIVNNLEKISFNFGPTLLSWLLRRHPDTYAEIVEADRASLARLGHGNAMAQAYNHPIMPLATRRDKLSQVRWGIEDFRHRFGRHPEGMWLPETAVDRETLAVLAECDLRFTILAPWQCRRVRPLKEGQWQEVADGDIDPSRAYRYAGAGGRGLALFFFDSPIARAIAFEGAAAHGETLRARLLGGFSAARAWPQLVHAATDGESYGHHTRFGDMALAAALERIERDGEVALTNYAAYLEAHPPTHEVDIVEGSSWSCAHGVERWRGDCGCRVGPPDWQQRWRGPVREAIDWLRDQIDPFYEARMGALVTDPWAARDDYIRVILNRTREETAAFFDRHQRARLAGGRQVDALRLLELQRHRLLMYSSDGWYFDEISGVEGLQVLKHAARAIDLAESLGFVGLEEGLTRRLAAAPSNRPELGDGAQIYRRLVLPARVDLRRVVAHYGISGLVSGHDEESRLHGFTIRRLDLRREAPGESALVVGRVRVESEITGETEEASFAVLHRGGQEFQCEVREGQNAACIYSLEDLLPDERRRILAEAAEGLLLRHASAYHRIWEEGRGLIRQLRAAGARVPDALESAVRHGFQREVIRAVEEGAKTGRIPEAALELVGEAQLLGLEIDWSPAAGLVQQAIVGMMEGLGGDEGQDRVRLLLDLLDATRRLGLRVELWRIQNRFFRLWRAHPERREAWRPLADGLGFRL